MTTTAIDRFCEVVMRATAEAIRSAAPTSAIARARAALGTETYAVLASSLRRQILSRLTERAQETLALVSAPLGQVGAQAVLAEIVAQALSDLREAASAAAA